MRSAAGRLASSRRPDTSVQPAAPPVLSSAPAARGPVRVDAVSLAGLAPAAGLEPQVPARVTSVRFSWHSRHDRKFFRVHSRHVIVHEIDAVSKEGIGNPNTISAL
jgi:hypothetical protein